MANLIEHLTSIAPDMRSGPSSGRRLLATTLCAMLVFGSVFPGFALAGEADSEGEGTVPPVEVPAPTDFDPGGEEAGLEETPASGGEESGAVETEPEADIAAPSPEEVTSAITEAPTEAAPPQPVAAPEPASVAPEPVQQQASEPVIAEPVANQSIVAPRPVKRHVGHAPPAPSEIAPSLETADREPPPSPQPAAATLTNSARSLATRDFYVVRPGDCLWRIAAALLPRAVGDEEVKHEVERLWQINKGRIGTDDPNLIYPGTQIRLR